MAVAELRTQAKRAAFEAALSAAISGEKKPQGIANKAYDEVIGQDVPAPVKALPQGPDPYLLQVAKLRQNGQLNARQLQEQAQKELDDYRASEAYAQNRRKRNEQLLQMAMDKTFAASSSPYGAMEQAKANEALPAVTDEREEELKKRVEEAKTQAIMEADLLQLQGWSQADRAALDSYIIGRDQRDAIAGNPMTDNGFLPQLPENARQLIRKYGQKRVDELAETLTRQRNAELTQKTAQDAREAVSGDVAAAIGHNAASIPVNAVGGLTGLMGYLQELGRTTKRYPTLDPNNAGNLLNVYGGNVRGQTALNIAGDQYDENGRKIADGGAFRQGLSYVYQGAMGIADTYARALMGGGSVGGATLAATNTFAQTVSEASAQGATPGQAVLLATAKAGIEALSEKIPLDELVKTAKAGKQTAMQIAKVALAQAGIEATTEEISLFGSILAESAILGEKSAYKDMTAEELLMEVAETGIVSGLSGAGSSVGASVVGNLMTPAEQADKALKDTAEQLVQEMPKMEPAQKSETDQRLDRAKNEAMGVEQKREVTPVTVDSDNGSSVRDQLRSNQDKLNAQMSVADIRAPQNFARMNKAQKMNWVIEKLRPTDYRVDRKGFGVINFAKKQLKSAFNYFKSGSAEEVAFEALPYVLEKGVEISSREDHKGRDYSTVTIAAPITINGRRGNMAVVVKQTTDNFYKIHRILTPDGTVFELGDAKNEAEPTPAGESPNNGSLATPISSASTEIVHQDTAEVNGEFDEGRAQSMDTSGASAEGEQGEIKGTGAAERDFAGTAEYDDLLSDDNVQRSRRDDVRQEEVPKRDADGRNVSENVGNAMGSNLTADAFTNTIKRLVTEGEVSHDTQTNKETLDKAAKAIAADGGMLESARRLREVADSGRTGAVDEAKALLIYSHYQDAIYNQSHTGEGKVDDYLLDAAADIYVTMAKFATNSGRSQQLFTLFRGMTADGQLRVIQQEIGRYVNQMKQLGNIAKNYETQIDEALLEDYRKACEENKRLDNAKTRKELQAAQNAVYMAEAAKMPATFKAKWDAWRYMCMLGNIKTNVRNVVGNTVFMPYKAAKDALAAGVERAFLDKSQRTKAVLTLSEKDQQLVKWAKADAASDKVKDALKYSAKLGDDVTNAKLEEHRQIFDTEVLDEIRKIVEKVPAAGDMLFKNSYYAQSLAGFMKARGYSVEDIQQGRVKAAVLNEGRTYAIQEAMKATFNDCNAFSDFMASIGRSGARSSNPFAKAANILAEGVLPFRRTPANIVVRFTEYSPLGLARGIWNAATKIQSGQISAAAAIDQMAAGLTGTAAMGLGFFLANGIGSFRLTGSGLSEDEERQGHQEYALEFVYDGKLYSYKIDWAAPANLPLFVGANLYAAWSGEGEQDAEVSKLTSFVYSSLTMFEPMLNLSCLSSLSDLFETGTYADGNPLYAVAAKIATSYITQGIPTLARQTVQAAQTNKQTTFANASDPLLRDLQYAAASTGVVPALKTDKVNVWGETESQGNGFLRTFNAFINPGSMKATEISKLEQEVSRLNESQPDSVSPPDTPKTISYTDANGERHTGYHLTADEYNTLAKVQGQTAKDILDKILESDTYAAMTDAQKASVFEYVYDYAREKGRTEALAGYEGISGWMQGIEGNEADAILDKAISGAFSDAFDLLEAEPEEAARALDQAYGLTGDDVSRANFTNAAAGRVKYFMEARNSGVSAEAFTQLYGQFRSIDQDPDLNTSGKAAQWSYQLEKAQEAGTITKEQKDKLKDSMVYYRMFPAKTAKFDQMTEAGISADDAVDIGKLLEGIEPQEGYTDVRSVQKASAIAGSDLTEEEKTAVMKIYLSDSQDENLDLMLALGYSAEDYAAAYEVTANTSGKTKIIRELAREFGVDWNTAKQLYQIFK